MVDRRRRPRVRTDRTSFEIQATGGFTTTTKFSNPFDVRGYSRLALFLNLGFVPTSATTVKLVVQWSDDGTTIPFGNNDNRQQSDYTILDFVDGSFNPKPYTADFTTLSGTLQIGVDPPDKHLLVDVGGAFCRVGVVCDATGGTYEIRAQRLVT